MKKITKAMSVFLAVLMAMSVFAFNSSAEDAECQHNYESEVITATCIDYGCTRYTCSLCGDVYEEDVVDAIGHKYGKWVISKDETCTEDGIKYRECTVCDGSVKGHIETGFVKALGHKFGDGVVVEPTCGQEGSTTYTCSNCGATEVKDKKPALAHTYGEWTTVNEATCTADGVKIRECSICDETAAGHIQSDIIKAKGHNLAVKEVVDPTYTEEGYTIYGCSECSYTEMKDFTPVLKGKVEAVELGEKVVVNYEQIAQLNPVVSMGGNVEYTVTYKSDAENVATVDENGNVEGKGMGKTVITCTVIDEYGNTVTDTVDVQVKFTFANWMTILRQVLQAAIDIVIGGLFGKK